jgi:hypothetical protein
MLFTRMQQARGRSTHALPLLWLLLSLMVTLVVYANVAWPNQAIDVTQTGVIAGSSAIVRSPGVTDAPDVLAANGTPTQTFAFGRNAPTLAVYFFYRDRHGERIRISVHDASGNALFEANGRVVASWYVAEIPQDVHARWAPGLFEARIHVDDAPKPTIVRFRILPT